MCGMVSDLFSKMLLLAPHQRSARCSNMLGRITCIRENENIKEYNNNKKWINYGLFSFFLLSNFYIINRSPAVLDGISTAKTIKYKYCLYDNNMMKFFVETNQQCGFFKVYDRRTSNHNYHSSVYITVGSSHITWRQNYWFADRKQKLHYTMPSSSCL